MSAFATQIKSSDSTLYRLYTEELFNSYLQELRSVSAAQTAYDLQTGQARLNVVLDQLRTVLRHDDPRIQYLP
jgi:hypothetical protein